MAKFPKDSTDQKELLAFFGTPGSEVSRQLVPVVPPFRFTYEGNPFPKFLVHQKCAPEFKNALDKIWAYYGKDQSVLDKLRISRTAGTYNPRKISGSERWSNHAFGGAVDINSEENGFNTGHGTMPLPVVAAFKSEGFAWGGDYKSRTDPMHFEAIDRGEPQRTFEEWLKFYGCPLSYDGTPPLSPPPIPVLIVTSELRKKMGQTILKFEARYDKDGHLAVFHPSDGSTEVAGINDANHADEVRKLTALLSENKYQEAEDEAIRYILKYTDTVTNVTADPGVEFYLRDCFFNRGPTGAVSILQMALGVKVDGRAGAATIEASKKADPDALLEKLRAARQKYEDDTYGSRPALRLGLVNRWNNALIAAKAFRQEAKSSVGAGAVVIGAAVGGAVATGTAVVVEKTKAQPQQAHPIPWQVYAGGALLIAIMVVVGIHFFKRFTKGFGS